MGQKSIDYGITLSLETHVSGEYFLFNGLNEFNAFIDNYPEIGVLIDISHNYYDNYIEDDIFNQLSSKNIVGLHISDSIPGIDFEKGTHLAIGDGKINFLKFFDLFKNKPINYGALEIKGSNNGIYNSLEKLNKIVYEIRN